MWTHSKCIFSFSTVDGVAFLPEEAECSRHCPPCRGWFKQRLPLWPWLSWSLSRYRHWQWRRQAFPGSVIFIRRRLFSLPLFPEQHQKLLRLVSSSATSIHRDGNQRRNHSFLQHHLDTLLASRAQDHKARNGLLLFHRVTSVQDRCESADHPLWWYHLFFPFLARG